MLFDTAHALPAIRGEAAIDLYIHLIWGVLGAAGFIVGLKMVSGRINTRGLLRSSGGREISPARVQLLFLSLIGAAGYVGLVLDTDGSALPEVPASLLALLGGSNSVYLGAKGMRVAGWLDGLRRVLRR